MRVIKLMALLVSCLLLFDIPAHASVPTESRFSLNREFSCDGVKFFMDVEPFMENNRIYLPVRFLSRSVGVPEDKVMWDPENGIITLVRPEDGAKAGIKLGERIIFKGETPVEMDVMPVEKEGRVFLPARFIAESFGYLVVYENASMSITIKSNKPVIKSEKLNTPVPTEHNHYDLVNLLGICGIDDGRLILLNNEVSIKDSYFNKISFMGNKAIVHNKAGGIIEFPLDHSVNSKQMYVEGDDHKIILTIGTIIKRWEE